MFLEYNKLKELSKEGKFIYLKYLESDLNDFKKRLDDELNEIKFEKSSYNDHLSILISLALGLPALFLSIYSILSSKVLIIISVISSSIPLFILFIYEIKLIIRNIKKTKENDKLKLLGEFYTLKEEIILILKEIFFIEELIKTLKNQDKTVQINNLDLKIAKHNLLISNLINTGNKLKNIKEEK